MRRGPRNDGEGLSLLTTDHLGGANQTLDWVNGNLNTEQRYDAWGWTRYTSGNTPTALRYTGQYQDEAISWMYDYGGRWYDTYLGRFLQADTIIPDSQGVIGYDRYAYANNNPVRFKDPSGHMVTECENGGCGGLNSRMKDPSQRRAFLESVKSYRSEGLLATNGIQSKYYNNFADPTADYNGQLTGSASIAGPSYQYEYSYDKDPMGNEIILPPNARSGDLFGLMNDFMGPYVPRPISKIDVTLYYSVYNNGNMKLPGMSVANHTGFNGAVFFVQTETSSGPWSTTKQKSYIDNFINAGQTGEYWCDANSKMPGLLGASVRIGIFRDDVGLVKFDIPLY